MATNKQTKKILLVDDDIDLLTQTKIHLNNAGFETVACESQEEAESALKNFSPDIVITDLMMEALDGGFSLTQYIKKKLPGIPVIVVTGITHQTGLEFSDVVENQDGIVKPDALLAKPVKIEALIAEIKKYL